MKIGDLGRATRTKVETVRFYEKIGLMPPPARTAANYRSYDEAHLRGLVANAKHTFPVTIMPAFYKTEGFIRPGAAYTGKAPEGDLPPILGAQQIEDVLAYLLTLK